jgi:hypothetical protein
MIARATTFMIAHTFTIAHAEPRASASGWTVGAPHSPSVSAGANTPHNPSVSAGFPPHSPSVRAGANLRGQL